MFSLTEDKKFYITTGVTSSSYSIERDRHIEERSKGGREKKYFEIGGDILITFDGTGCDFLSHHCIC